VKDLELFNISLLNKWKWRCLTDKNALWYDLLKFKYGSLARKVLSRDGPMIRRKDSNWWKDILLAGTTNMTSEAWFPNNIKCNLGNGLEIDFWKDKWLGNEPFCSLFPPLYSSRPAEFSMVADNGIWQNTSWTAAEGKGIPKDSLLDLASYSLEHLAVEECNNFQRGCG